MSVSRGVQEGAPGAKDLEAAGGQRGDPARGRGGLSPPPAFRGFFRCFVGGFRSSLKLSTPLLRGSPLCPPAPGPATTGAPRI